MWNTELSGSRFGLQGLLEGSFNLQHHKYTTKKNRHLFFLESAVFLDYIWCIFMAKSCFLMWTQAWKPIAWDDAKSCCILFTRTRRRPRLPARLSVWLHAEYQIAGTHIIRTTVFGERDLKWQESGTQYFEFLTLPPIHGPTRNQTNIYSKWVCILLKPRLVAGKT